MADIEGFEDALDAAEDAIDSPADVFLRRIADRVGAKAGATAVFGEPVTADGVTVIPVARARWGFGGGAGGGDDEDAGGSGAGGGGGASTQPIGYIELAGGQARFVGVSDPVRVWPLVLAAGVAAWLSLQGLRALFR
ncbi:MAG: spore germination protein GerW family protein [Dehalococcoidia bacterium]